MYDLCTEGTDAEGLPRRLEPQKSLEEILRQELAWTLEQVGWGNRLGWVRVRDFVLQIGEEEGEVEEEHPVETFTNQAFKNDDEE